MTDLELLLVLLILLGVAGISFTFLLVLAVLIGGTRDLLYRLRDRAEESRRSLGLCTCCGYDLRGSPTRCPECGRAALRTLTALKTEPDRVGPVAPRDSSATGPTRPGSVETWRPAPASSTFA